MPTRCAYPIGQFVSQLVIAGTVEIWGLNRIGRALGELVAMVDQLEAAGVGFESLTERIDTSTAAGELVFHVFGAIAQYERCLIVERARAGVAAGTRSLPKGRPPGRADDTIAPAPWPRQIAHQAKFARFSALREARSIKTPDVALRNHVA